MLFDEFLRRFRYVSRSYNKIEHSHSYLFRFFLFDKLHKEKKQCLSLLTSEAFSF